MLVGNRAKTKGFYLDIALAIKKYNFKPLSTQKSILNYLNKVIKKMFNNKTILVTGGTGSFGKKFVKTCLSKFNQKNNHFTVETN